MVVLPNLFIIPVVIMGNLFAAAEAMSIPNAAAHQKDRSPLAIYIIVFDKALDGSTNTVRNVSISSGITELGPNYFSDVTSDMGIQIENPSQIENMKWDVFGGEKRQSFGDSWAVHNYKPRKRRAPEWPGHLSLWNVEMRACVENDTLVKLNIFESGKVTEEVNCHWMRQWLGVLYFDLKIKKFAEGWCCGGMANATEFLESQSQIWDGLEFDLDSTGISEVPIDVFRNELYVEKVKLEHNKLTDTEIIANLPTKLKELDLSFNKITRIKANSFSHLRELTSLNLEYNRITTLEPHAFENNEKLVLLHLNDNRISILAVGVFTGLPVLRILNLGSNLLKTIPFNVFNLTRLQTLDLSDNMITTIERGALKSSCDRNVFYLDISGNPMPRLQNGALFGVPKISNCNIRMDHTPIEFIEGGVFDNISLACSFNNGVAITNTCDQFLYENGRWIRAGEMENVNLEVIQGFAKS